MTLTLALLLLLGCSSEPPSTFDYLRVVELSDVERADLQIAYRPRISTALQTDSIVIGEPLVVVPPGQEKDIAPGPVEWEVRIPVYDYATGQGYVARLASDRERFVLEPILMGAPLSTPEADKAFEVANSDPAVRTILASARAAGYHVDQGAMSQETSIECPGRCVDVRFIGFSHDNPALYSGSSIVHARVSLGLQAVVSYHEFAWLPADP